MCSTHLVQLCLAERAVSVAVAQSQPQGAAATDLAVVALPKAHLRHVGAADEAQWVLLHVILLRGPCALPRELNRWLLQLVLLLLLLLVLLLLVVRL